MGVQVPMGVQVRQVGPARARVPVTVVQGVRRSATVDHLARSLREGAAFADTPALVVDVGAVSGLGEAELAALDGACRVWARAHRWLAVAGLDPAWRPDLLPGFRFPDAAHAARGARRFFTQMNGPPAGHARTLLAALWGNAVGAADLAAAALAWGPRQLAGRLTAAGPGQPPAPVPTPPAPPAPPVSRAPVSGSGSRRPAAGG